jgi:hypothetical protein
MSFTPFRAFLLFPVIVALQFGHALRRRREDASPSAAIEGAVFAPFGSLLAFTFSGAVTRYDAHRQLVLQKSNDIGMGFPARDSFISPIPTKLSSSCATLSTEHPREYPGSFHRHAMSRV